MAAYLVEITMAPSNGLGQQEPRELYKIREVIVQFSRLEKKEVAQTLALHLYALASIPPG